MGFPGYNGTPPESAKSIAKHFQHAGFETFAIGQMGSHSLAGSVAKRPISPLGQRRGLRPFLWLHGCRRRRLPFAALERSPSVRNLDGQAGLSPDHRSGRPRHREHYLARLDLSRPAFLHVLGAQRHALAAPGRAEVHRHVQGQVRHGLGQGPRNDLREADGDEDSSRRHQAFQRHSRDSQMGQLERRTEKALRPPDGSFRRHDDADRRAGRPHHRHPQAHRAIRQYAHHPHVRQRRQRRRRVERTV